MARLIVYVSVCTYLSEMYSFAASGDSGVQHQLKEALRWRTDPFFFSFSLIFFQVCDSAFFCGEEITQS